MSIKNKLIAVVAALSLGIGLSTASFAHSGHHGGHHGKYHGKYHGKGGYHGQWGHKYRHGWYGPGYIVAPGVNRACRWIPRHRNNYGHWVPARRVCRVY